MSTSEGRPGERVKDVRFTDDTVIVDLLDGRTISVPLVWYPRLLSATPAQRANWRLAGGGFGIHWPDIDEDLSTEGAPWCARSAGFGSDWPELLAGAMCAGVVSRRHARVAPPPTADREAARSPAPGFAPCGDRHQDSRSPDSSRRESHHQRLAPE
jgi:hypothetical protein